MAFTLITFLTFCRAGCAFRKVPCSKMIRLEHVEILLETMTQLIASVDSLITFLKDGITSRETVIDPRNAITSRETVIDPRDAVTSRETVIELAPEMDVEMENELSDKIQYQCRWMNSRLNMATDLVLYLCEGGMIADLLEEAKKQVHLSENGSGRLRIVEIVNNKIYSVLNEDRSLNSIIKDNRDVLRIEEIPIDELEVSEDELLIPVAHFQVENVTTYYFGVPFLLKVKHNEPFHNVKERIQRKLEIPSDEFERYRFAIIVMNRPEPVGPRIDLVDFLEFPVPDSEMSYLPFLGMEHMD